MKTTTKKLSDTKVELTVVLDAADLAPAREQAILRLAANLKIQGFRKGKVPLSLAEKQLNQNDIASEAINIAVRSSLPKAFDALKQPPLAVSGVNVTKYVPGESAEYTASADILPDIKVGDYKKLKTKMKVPEITDSDIEDVLNGIAKGYAEKSVVRRPAALGDEVIIDFVGKRENGEAFRGGSAKDHHLTLGSGEFIPGFEDGVVGHEPGDKFDIKVTFPEDYPEKSLAGQPATFETLLKQVNEIKTPAIDDALAAKAGQFKTLDELKADIKTNLNKQNTYRAGEQYREDLVAELVSKSTVSAPEVLVEDQLRLMRGDLARNAASRGMRPEEYLERMQETQESWEKQAREVAEQRVKSSLVLQILARDHDITVSNEEVEAKIAELRDLYQRSREALDNLKKPEVRQDIRNRMVIDKTLDFLAEANNPKK